MNKQWQEVRDWQHRCDCYRKLLEYANRRLEEATASWAIAVHDSHECHSSDRLCLDILEGRSDV
jgi:hypothetical protein